MAMFNQWVRINGDIKTKSAGEQGWAKTISDFTMGISVRTPEAFWMNVLLFEFIGDDFNQAMRENKELAFGDDGRPMHPILVQIGVTHTSEEARHIAYARKWLEKGMETTTEQEVKEIQDLAHVGAQLIIDRRSNLPLHYSDQLEPYVSKEEFDSMRSDSLASLKVIRQLKELLDEFVALRIIHPDVMAKWEDSGVFN
ncbi:MAG: hypothetical protein HKL80_04625 [Acidimicrobiales bacterium]|nr:hypothetical protein [Acidimicrobiales bacterium]